MTSLTVVIACRDRDLLLTGCLEALQLRPGDEVIVVDADSATGAVSQVAGHAGARVIRSSNRAASAARNLGWKSASNDLIAFTDDDCRPTRDWCAQVVAALSELDAVCGRVVADGPGHLSVLDDPEPLDYARGTSPSVLGHGANLAVRRSALAAVDGWDEHLGPGTTWPGAEDKDLLLRLLGKGFRVGYRPDPVVTHLQWRTTRQALRAEHGYGRGVAGLAHKGLGPSTRTWLRDAGRATWKDVRGGYRFGVLAGLARSAGIVRGRWDAR